MADDQPKPIRRIDIFKVFLRSFFLQSVWNYRSLISVGFEICLLPVVKRLYPEVQPRREFLQRHLKFFNAHPYLASYALGVSLRLEENIASGDGEICTKLDRIKELLIPTLGAKGDQLFWMTIRPSSLIIGALGLLVFDSTISRVAVLITAFLIYNIPHFYIRYLGLIEGYQYGLDVYKCLTGDRFKKLERIYRYLGMVTFFIFVIVLLINYFQIDPLRIVFLLGSLLYSWMIYKISSNFYYSTLLTILFFIIVSFIFF